MSFALQQFGFSIGNLLTGVVDYAFYILLGFILASIVFNWLPGYPSSGFFQAIYDAVRNVTNPILMPIRNAVPPLRIGGFGLDLSPIIALIGLRIAHYLLTQIIVNFLQPVTG
jgi:YggT family protein